MSSSDLTETLVSWSKGSSNHVLPKLVDTKNSLLRIIWICLLITSFIICLINIINDVKLYYQYRTTTKTEFLSEISAQLPAVSLCAYPNVSMSDLNLTKCSFSVNNDIEYDNCKFQQYFNNCTIVNSAYTQPYILYNVTNRGNQFGFHINVHLGLGTRLFFVIIHDRNILYLTPGSEKHLNSLTRCGNDSTIIDLSIKNRIIHRKLPRPYGNCTDNWNDVDERIVNYYKSFSALTNLSYNDELCFRFCILVNISRDECISKCPMNCNSLTYIVKEFVYCEKFFERQSIINVFYDRFEYTRTSEIPALSSGQLTGLIGGYLGLFLGMSVLSLIDLFEILLHISFGIIKNGKAFKLVRRTLQVSSLNSSIHNGSIYLKLKEKTVNWCLKSNIHGIPRLVENKYKFTRLVWLILFVSSTIYCIITLVQNVVNYNKYNSTTYIDVIRSTYSTYPALTICNKEMKTENFSFFQSAYCTDNGEQNVLTPKNFSITEINGFGFCFTMNSGFDLLNNSVPLNQVTLSGSFSYCSIELSAKDRRKFYFYIHNQSVYPLFGSSFSSYSENEIIVGIKKEFSYKLKHPYSNCNDDWNHLKNYSFLSSIKIRGNYNREKCLNLCKNYESNGYSSYNVFKMIQYCESVCPEACESVSYSVTLSINKVYKDTVFVYLLFDDTKYSEIRYIPSMTLNQLVGSTGYAIINYRNPNFFEFIH